MLIHDKCAAFEKVISSMDKERTEILSKLKLANDILIEVNQCIDNSDGRLDFVTRDYVKSYLKKYNIEAIHES
jgi:hypothetical protein